MAHEKVVTNTSIGTYQTLTIGEYANIVAEESDEYAIVNLHIPYEGKVAETHRALPTRYYNSEQRTTRQKCTRHPVLP